MKYESSLRRNILLFTAEHSTETNTEVTCEYLQQHSVFSKKYLKLLKSS